MHGDLTEMKWKEQCLHNIHKKMNSYLIIHYEYAGT